MNSADVKKLLDVQCGPETARRVTDAFAAVEAERDRTERERATLEGVVRFFVGAPSKPASLSAGDAAAVLSAYFALRRVAELYEAVRTGQMREDKLDEGQRRIYWAIGANGYLLRQLVENGQRGNGLREFFDGGVPDARLSAGARACRSDPLAARDGCASLRLG